MTPQEVAAAFEQVDRLREAALEAAPSVAALLRHGRAIGMPEGRLAKALGMSPPASYWCANLPPAKGRDALLAEPDHHPSGEAMGDLILRYVQSNCRSCSNSSSHTNGFQLLDNKAAVEPQKTASDTDSGHQT